MSHLRGEEPDPAEGLRGLGGGDLYKRLTRNLGYLAGGTGGAAALNMLALAVNVRALSPEEFGILVLLQSSALTIRGLVSIGTQQPVVHLGSQALVSGDPERLGRLIGLTLLLDLASGLAALLVASVAIAVASAGGLLTVQHQQLAAIFGGALLFTGYLSSNGIFRLLDRFDILSLIQLAGAAVTLAVASVLYLVQAPLVAYVALWASVMVLVSQAQLWISLAMLKRHGVAVTFRYTGLHRSDKKLVRTYTWSTWGTIVIETLRSHADSLLVGAIISVEAVGIYNVAKQLAGILRKVTDIYASAIFPEVSALAARHEIAAARRLRRKMMVAGAGLGAVVIATMVPLGVPALQLLFGDRFAAGYGVLMLLLTAAALQLISHTLAVYVQVFVGPAPLLWIYIIGLAAYAGAAVAGLFYIGLTGGALGQLVFSLTIIACALFLTQRALRRTEQGAASA